MDDPPPRRRCIASRALQRQNTRRTSPLTLQPRASPALRASPHRLARRRTRRPRSRHQTRRDARRPRPRSRRAHPHHRRHRRRARHPRRPIASRALAPSSRASGSPHPSARRGSIRRRRRVRRMRCACTAHSSPRARSRARVRRTRARAGCSATRWTAERRRSASSRRGACALVRRCVWSSGIFTRACTRKLIAATHHSRARVRVSDDAQPQRRASDRSGAARGRLDAARARARRVSWPCDVS